MKRFIFVLLMMITANVVNAQYCKICDENDEVITWKTWKYLKYDCAKYKKNNNIYNANCKAYFKLSQCQHNKFSVITINVDEVTSDPEWDGSKPLVEQKASFYSSPEDRLYINLRKIYPFMSFEIGDYIFYISLDKYPTAYEDIDGLLKKATQAELLKKTY